MYSSHIVCDNWEEFHRLVKVRNLDEVEFRTTRKIPKFQDYSKYGYKRFMENLPEIAHQVAFLSFINMKAGFLTTEDVIGDAGVLHEIIHLNHFKDSKSFNHRKIYKEIKILLKDLYSKPIGIFENKL